MRLAPYRPRIHLLETGLDDVLQAELDSFGIYRPLVLTDVRPGTSAYLAEMLDMISAARVEADTALHLCEGGCTLAQARTIARRLFSEGRDGLVAIGGRAAIDLGKYAAREFCRVRPGLAFRASDLRPMPLIVIPAGPEDGAGLRASVRVREGDGRYLCLQDEAFVPAAVICDMRLHTILDDRAAVCADLDVVMHCIETLTRSRISPPARGMAIDGLRRAWRMLGRRAAGSVEPRTAEEVFSAAVNSALAEDGGLGAVHALALAIEEELNGPEPHGFYHAAVFGPVMTFNAPAIARAIPDIEEAMEVSGGVAGIAAAISGIAEHLGLPVTLGSIGLDRAARARIASSVSTDSANVTNPRHVSKADYRSILDGSI